uniref:Nascent polypeptide-associated complex subunit beta n=1 Tax=Aegilops tauschii TaxID=37682 RepID=M8CBV3_AEGTA
MGALGPDTHQLYLQLQLLSGQDASKAQPPFFHPTPTPPPHAPGSSSSYVAGAHGPVDDFVYGLVPGAGNGTLAPGEGSPMLGHSAFLENDQFVDGLEDPLALMSGDELSAFLSDEAGGVPPEFLARSLAAFAGQDNVIQCLNIASGLAEKTALDVAYRIRWLSDLKKKNLGQEKSAVANVTKGKGTKVANKKNNKHPLSKEALDSRSVEDIIRDNNRLMDKIEEILRTGEVNNCPDYFYHVKMNMDAMQNKVKDLASVMLGLAVGDEEWEDVLKDRHDTPPYLFTLVCKAPKCQGFLCLPSAPAAVNLAFRGLRVMEARCIPMNVDKLKKMAGAVRTGGKGSVRRKKKAVHKTTTTDDKRLQSTLKRVGVNTIPGIEEVNIFKDDVVIQFQNPKVQASIAANTWVVSGTPQTKKLQDLLPTIINQLGNSMITGPDNLDNLRRLAEQFQKQMPGGEAGGASIGAAQDDDDDVPELVPGETFEEAAEEKKEPEAKKEAEPEEKKESS